MKAYRDETGKVTLFRPDMNMRRMNSSALRVALPVGSVAIIHSHICPYPLFHIDVQWRRSIRTDQNIGAS